MVVGQELNCVLQLLSYPFPSIVTYPSIKNLGFIKWKDEQGNRQSLKLIHDVSAKWRDIGAYVGLSPVDLDNYLTMSQNDIMRSCQRVFDYWINQNGCKEYPMTWLGISELLCDVEMSALAKKLKELEALGCMGIDLK